MSAAVHQSLEHHDIPWLFAAALVTTMPHFLHQPFWLSTLTCLVLGYAAWQWWNVERLPRRWLLVLMVLIASGGVLLEFRTLLGRDAGVAMLVLFMALKLLELRNRRDAMVLVTLGYFLLLTHYFYSQSIPTGIWLIAAMLVVTATLIRIHGGPSSTPLATLRYAGLLTVQALPFMLLLYLLFPRISGPLWGLPQDAHSARSGLTNQMSPGSFSNLALSSEIAFRVRFDGEIPTRDKLYWRGPVMDQFDGRTWWAQRGKAKEPQIEALSPPISYESTIEPNQHYWLLALDSPSPTVKNFVVNNTLTVTVRDAIVQRSRFSLSSVIEYRYNVIEDPATLSNNLLLPPKLNPKTLALAKTWREQSEDPNVTVNLALALFSTDTFAYTLQPPLLGENSIDEFLFQSKRGFCEHYAAAFVVLMRGAGIPARVVGGYQGGERNPVDGYLVVRQSDAHAWAEIWLAGQGWVRVDPTASVSPSRLAGGIAAAMPSGEPLPALLTIRSDLLRTIRYRWEAINNAWNQQVLGYNPERQRELFSRLGLGEVTWQNMTTLLVTLSSILLLIVATWTLHHRPRTDPAQRLWHTALRRMAKRQVNCAPWEPPLALLRRIEAERPDLANAFAAVVSAYLASRYSAPPGDLKHLRQAVAQLP